MVVIDSKSGQLSNRMFSFATFIANSIEHGYKLYNPNFSEYEKHFPYIDNNDFLGHHVTTRMSNKGLLNKVMNSSLDYLRILCKRNNGKLINFEIINIDDFDIDERKYDLNSDQFINKVKTSNIFAQGWNFRDHKNFMKYSDEIRQIFKPRDLYIENAKLTVEKARSGLDCLVGVHIRRGDYERFFNGAYFYGLKNYARYMQQISDDKFEGGVRFLLCSNETVPLQPFDGLNVTLSTGNFIEDMLALSYCDYIIGPPSTFSMWASFYGKTPLIILDKPKAEIEINDASQIVSIDHFLNGRVFTHSIKL